MFSFSDPDISVDQLMHEIRATVARRHRETGAQIPESASGLQLSTNGNDSLTWQPDFQPHPNDDYHVNDFLKYHGATFVRNAYLGLLKRPADPSGNERFLAALATGNLNKLDVLARLHYSDEGKQAGVKVAGLALPAFVRKLERLPYVGYIIGVAIAVARLPNLHRQLRQSEFDLMTRQENLSHQFDRAHKQMLQGFQEAIGQVTQTVAEHQRTLASLSDRQQQFEQQQKALTETAENFRQESARLHDESVAAINRVSESQAALSESQAALKDRLTVIEDQAKSWSLDELYASFEDEFRGEREEIKKRLEVYLPILRDAGITADALDLGCGRGEWLELLRDEGVAGYGIDHNATFVARCRALELNVIETDAIPHLQSLAAESLSIITGFHIVEHVPFKELVQMVDEILRVLKPGGIAIFETPNPENFMVGSYTFYTDPTHRNPIPSSTLKFLLEMRGFGRTEVMKLREWTDAFIPGDSELVKRFNEYFYGAPDYAVVARKV